MLTFRGRTAYHSRVRLATAGLALLAALAAARVGGAGEVGPRVIGGVPRLEYFASSHATAAAQVMAFHGVKADLPPVVVIGGLEGRIYRCECGKDLHLWDIAAGTRQWAAAEGIRVKTEARALRGAPAAPSSGGQSDAATPWPSRELDSGFASVVSFPREYS